jgi:hypothetical protein
MKIRNRKEQIIICMEIRGSGQKKAITTID